MVDHWTIYESALVALSQVAVIVKLVEVQLKIE